MVGTLRNQVRRRKRENEEEHAACLSESERQKQATFTNTEEKRKHESNIHGCVPMTLKMNLEAVIAVLDVTWKSSTSDQITKAKRDKKVLDTMSLNLDELEFQGHADKD